MMKEFDWVKFVRDSEIRLASPRKVGFLVYAGIEIHPAPPTIGAYTYEKETTSDKRLIGFFESHGYAVNAIISAINEGLTAHKMVKEFPPKPVFHVDQRLLQLAFEKGKELREELDEARENPTIFFR